MKGIDIFCASQAATAIRMMDEGSSSSSSSSSTIHLGRAIDRYNPIIRDSTRTPKSIPRTPCSSNNHHPIAPKPRNNQNIIDNKHQINTPRKLGSTSKRDIDEKRKSISSVDKQKSDIIDNKHQIHTPQKLGSTSKRNNSISSVGDNKKGWGCTKPGDFISPPSSSRYLLSDRAFFEVLSDFDPILNLAQAVKKEESESSVSLPPPSSRSSHQVVVLRVSLHCKGCERKMRKHISRMEGVTSFTIDFAAKKVTVIGDVTPLSVLASVSKVKNAQLLAPTISSTVQPVASDHSEVNKLNAIVV